MSGSAEADVTLGGTVAQPVADISLASDEAMIAGKPLEDAALKLHFERLTDIWNATANLTGSFDGQPLQGSVVAKDSKLAIPFLESVNLNLAGNVLTGQIQPDSEGRLQGAFKLNAPELKPLGTLGRVDLSGSANADIRIEETRDGIFVKANGAGQSLVFPGASVGQANFEGEISNLTSDLKLQGQVVAKSVSAGSLSIRTVSLNAVPVDGRTDLTLKADAQDLSADVTANLLTDNGKTTVLFRRGQGRYQSLNLAINEGTAVVMEGERVVLQNTSLQLAGGRVNVSGAVMPQADLSAEWSGLSLAQLSSLAPGLSASGALSGNAKVKGALDNPQITWTLDANGARVSQGAASRVPAIGLNARGDGSLSLMKITAALSTADATKLDLSGSVRPQAQALDLGLKGDASLALVNAFIDRETRFAGRARVDLTINGSFSSPQISGGVTLRDGAVRDAATAVALNAITGEVAFSGGKLSINNLNGSIAAGGKFAISGTIDTGQPSLPADLSMTVTEGKYKDGETVNAAFGADLKLTGPIATRPALGGSVTINRLDIRIPSGGKSSGAAVNVTHRNPRPGFEAPIKQAKSSSKSSSDLQLDIALNAPSGILVRGYGLDAELGGQVRLTGSASSPVTAGAFEMIRGRMELLSRRFEFSRGRITFQGDPMPYLDFEAQAQRSDTTVYVQVEGYANDPKISFRSAPELPEEEILARIVFDRSFDSLSPLQAARLADLAAQLSGVIQGPGVFDSLRNALGVDDLDIRENDAGETTVGVSKAINERLRVGVEQGTGSDSNRVKVDLDVGGGVSIEGFAGASGDGRLGIAIEREY
jgi:translocation and assembly module TamB